MAPSGGLWAPLVLRTLKKTIQKTSNLVKIHISGVFHPSELQPVLLRLPCHQPIHFRALIRKSKRRFFTTQINNNATSRRLFGTISGHKNESRILGQLRPETRKITSISVGNAPFYGPLRPSLTAGAFPRTAGGYRISGGRFGGSRYFSSTPTPPARVVQDVFAAFRMFALSRQINLLETMPSLNKNDFYKNNDISKEAVEQDWFTSNRKSGSHVDFHFKPSLMSLYHLTEKTASIRTDIEQLPINLNTDGLLEELAIDCSRTMKDLSLIMSDLKKFAILGDLPITLEQTCILRVHFLGHDFESVERICQDIGIQRGIIGENEDCYRIKSNQVKLFYPNSSKSSLRLSSVESLLRLDARICSQDSSPIMENKISESSEIEFCYLDRHSLDEINSWNPESIQSNYEGD